MSTVELVGLRKSYGQTEVIHGVDLSIAEGEFLALVGPSGCGKSTILRMIAGLESITDGEVRFDGRRMNESTPKKRNVAMVFQNYALYPHMTVRENVSLNLRLAGIPKTEIRKRVDDAARLLEIEEILDRKPAQLSGGQRQRVAMGRAIVRDPEVFLFDEPLSNLDAKLRVQMRAEIKALHNKVRTTAIYVTHDQIEALTLADRIAVLNAGRIEQLGTPMELYSAPVNRFVAGFIGSPAMNFLDGKIDGDQVHLADEAGTLTLPPEHGVADGRNLAVGVRPEHIRISDSGGNLKGIIEQVEPTGSQTHAAVRCGQHLLQAVFEGMLPLHAGESVSLNVASDHIYLFDADDGRAVLQAHR
ncbi:ABC transporter ATP-binding protein [Oceaniovalibus sp. ACAM 378]|uniref:ABC transporter ATP-binding protein n=1 Tax=Oceaniovalibus sp. ACAM 378 TaxID=2599923 RepID=UPI0011D74D45|nr:sn-glycerol-3-phosphate ABC transporter ATP-binding protein UgpC [Oceaniovalibus sp. ACAM 378]TYB90149.1 sn-glycerol-3-phosphate ABC transporter ATP-binding protein UgpC [Oceaniovalibus sp. ACAM 378]